MPLAAYPYPHHNSDTGLDLEVCGRGGVGRVMHFQDVHEKSLALSDDLITILCNSCQFIMAYYLI